MTQAKNGDTVRIHYSGTLDDGSLFDTTEGQDPLELKLGEGRILPGFESAIIGLEEGGKRQITISPEEGFGERDEGLVIDVERANIPPHIELEVGGVLQVTAQDGGSRNVIVKDLNETKVTLDGNHPLAGRTLTFDIELVELVA